MRKVLDFHPVIMRKVEDIMKQEGHRTFTTAVFSAITQYYDHKYFDKRKSPNIKIIPEEKLTPEQYCESKGGRVGIENGIERCFIKQGAMTRSFPLESVEKFI